MFRNDESKKFINGITRAGTFYLVQGSNKAIYGALTFVNITANVGYLSEAQE